MKTFKVAIVGGRKFADQAHMTEVMDKALSAKVLDGCKIIIVSGRAKGADLMGEVYAKSRGYEIEEHTPDWKDLTAIPCRIGKNQYGEYNALAGHNRNQKMRDSADAVVAFWDGKSKGTKEMIEESKKQNLFVKVYYY